MGSLHHVRRSAAGQAFDCNSLVLYLCVYMCISRSAQMLLLLCQTSTWPFSGYLYIIALHALAKVIKNRQEIPCHLNVMLNPALIKYAINIQRQREKSTP